MKETKKKDCHKSGYEVGQEVVLFNKTTTNIRENLIKISLDSLWMN